MDMPDWVTGFPGSVLVSDLEHTLIWMNDKAAASYESQGGRALIGRGLGACHNERSRGIMDRMLEDGKPNVYTIEKKGVKKIIYQTAWRNGEGGDWGDS